jgi:type VI secretion system protein ImpJ
MKLQSKIVWSDGMYLAPHHFQAQNRYFESSAHFVTTSLWNNCYGFAACQLNEDALRGGKVILENARGMFEDGLVFDIPECDERPEPFDVAPAFTPTTDSVTVSLSVPRWRGDRQNCRFDDAPGNGTRYTGTMHMLPDENTGRDERSVRLAHKNIRFTAGPEPNDDLLSLPMARVKRDGAGHYIFDRTFVPTSIRLTVSRYLTSMLQRLVEILEDKATTVARDQSSYKGNFKTALSGRQVSQFWFLHAINSSLSPLRHLLLSKHGHPEELFREMSRLAGALCTFGLETHPKSLPEFNFSDPGPCFAALDLHIRRHLELAWPSQALVIPIRPVDRYFYEGKVEDQRCFEQSRWIFGIHSSIGEAQLITRTPQYVKICSSKFVQEIVKRALPGLEMTHLSVPPSEISAKVDSQYFAISRTGPCWEHIMQTRTVGIYVPGELPAPTMELMVLLES